MNNNVSSQSIYESIMKKGHNLDLFGTGKGSGGGLVRNMNFEPMSKIQKQLARHDEMQQAPKNLTISSRSSESEASQLSEGTALSVCSTPVSPVEPLIRHKRRSIFTPASGAGFKRKFPNAADSHQLDSSIDDNDQKNRMKKIFNIIEAEKPSANKECKLSRINVGKNTNTENDMATKLKELSANIDAKLHKSFYYFVLTLLVTIVGMLLKQTILWLATLKLTTERCIGNLWRSINPPSTDFAKNLINLPMMMVAVLFYVGIWTLHLVAHGLLLEMPEAVWRMVGESAAGLHT